MRRAENRGLPHKKTVAGGILHKSPVKPKKNSEKIRKFPVLRLREKSCFCGFRASFSKPEIISWINRAILWTLDITLWISRFFLSTEKQFVHRFADEIIKQI
jgi:hypothetical protein